MVKEALEAVCRFIKEQYEDFIPFWKWKPLAEKKKKSREIQQYRETLNACRVSQYFLAIFAVLFALTFERSRQLFVSAAIRDGILLLLMELSSYLFIGYFMGLKRFPANYISLVIIKTFVVLERTFKPQVHDFELKVLQESQFHGQWSLLSYNPNSGARAATPVEAQLRNLSLMFVLIGTMWAISKYTDFDVSKYEKTILITTTLATSSAALLLITTFAFDAFPEIKPYHRKCCEMWTLFAASTFIFTLAFLFQRIKLLFEGKIKPSLNLRGQWECVLFMLAMYILIRYIPVIHKGYSVRRTLAYKSSHLTHTLLPGVVTESFYAISAYAYAVGELVAKMNASLL